MSVSHTFGTTVAAISAARGHRTPESSSTQAGTIIATAIGTARWWNSGIWPAYAAVTVIGVTIATTATTAQRRSQRKVSEAAKVATAEAWSPATTGSSARSKPNALSNAMSGGPACVACGPGTRLRVLRPVPQSLEQFAERCSLGHERVGTGRQGIGSEFLSQAVCDDANVRPAGLDLGRRRDTVEARHANVNDDDVGLQPLNGGERLLAIGRLANQFECGLHAEHSAQGAPRAGAIVR